MSDKKKIKITPSCKNGNHTYIVTNWFMRGGKQKALDVRCQHCLIPISLEEIETLEWREQEGLD